MSRKVYHQLLLIYIIFFRQNIDGSSLINLLTTIIVFSIYRMFFKSKRIYILSTQFLIHKKTSSINYVEIIATWPSSETRHLENHTTLSVIFLKKKNLLITFLVGQWRSLGFPEERHYVRLCGSMNIRWTEAARVAPCVCVVLLFAVKTVRNWRY